MYRPIYRPDIDGLRAIAVLSVMGFHFFPASIGGGFVGVDIFFVISGYLISKIIFSSLREGGFSFVEFYRHRINRIFPALVVVLAATMGSGWLMLTAGDFKLLGKHIAAGAAFISNFILWNEIGYFDSGIEKKPLLHLWSLATEEQFYAIWPAFLFVAYRLRWNFGYFTFVICGLSFFYNVVSVDSESDFSFYSPITRFWELMLGSVLSYLDGERKQATHIYGDILSVIGIVLLGISFILIDKEKSFPGWWAILPTIGTFFLISAGQSAWINSRFLSNSILTFIGKISYPLYLWHWPLLSFSYIVGQGSPGFGSRILIIIASFILSWITFRYVEYPIRWGSNSPTKAVGISGVLIVIGMAGMAVYTISSPAPNEIEDGSLPWADIRKSYLSECPFSFKNYHDCYLFSKESPAQVLLIGDSHADHLIPGLAKYRSKDLSIGALILPGGCPPLWGIERLKNSVPIGNYGNTGARCSEVNNARLQFALNATASTIVLSMVALEYSSAQSPGTKIGEFKYSYNGIPMGSADAFQYALNLTIERFVGAGKKIIIVMDNPMFNIPHLGACLKPDLPLPEGLSRQLSCTLSRSVVIEQQSSVNTLYRELEAKFPDRVIVFNSLDYLCDEEICPIEKEGVILYRDRAHFSYAGSLFLAKRLVAKFGF